MYNICVISCFVFRGAPLYRLVLLCNPFSYEMKLFQFKIQKGGKEKREGGRRKQRGRKIGKDRNEREGGGVK